MLNDTILRFGYPQTLLKEYEKWVVLLRSDQITVGSLVLACKEPVTRMPDVSAAAFAELTVVTFELENALQTVFRFDKINYLLLMMVDKYVHFHVIPRYSESREAVGMTFHDPAWPKQPDITRAIDLTSDQFNQLAGLLRDNWP